MIKKKRKKYTGKKVEKVILCTKARQNQTFYVYFQQSRSTKIALIYNSERNIF